MNATANTRELIEQAITACGGSQAGLARAIGGKCRQGHVYKWLQSGQVSAEVAAQIERATAGAVTRADLRPDLFGDLPPVATAQPAVDQQQAA
ncbi:YdaS family helix-turn-helix protein [Nevskia sp.]|uniref:transcriptional regulator n=1 Tax=Nevskia sp. TaxID=1929292 RepID=UPI0034590B1F